MTSIINAQTPTQTATKPEGLSIEEKREKNRIYHKHWRETHKERSKEINYKWRRKNPKVYSACVARSQKKHRDRYNKYQREYNRKKVAA